MEVGNDKGKLEVRLPVYDREPVPTSPACYSNSDEVREEFKNETGNDQASNGAQ